MQLTVVDSTNNGRLYPLLNITSPPFYFLDHESIPNSDFNGLAALRSAIGAIGEAMAELAETSIHGIRSSDGVVKEEKDDGPDAKRVKCNETETKEPLAD